MVKVHLFWYTVKTGDISTIRHILLPSDCYYYFDYLSLGWALICQISDKLNETFNLSQNWFLSLRKQSSLQPLVTPNGPQNVSITSLLHQDPKVFCGSPVSTASGLNTLEPRLDVVVAVCQAGETSQRYEIIKWNRIRLYCIIILIRIVLKCLGT